MLFYLSSILNFHLLSIMIIKIISPLIVIPLSRTLKAIKRLNSQVLIALRVITVWMRISQADTCDMTNTTCLQSPISTWKNAITKQFEIYVLYYEISKIETIFFFFKRSFICATLQKLLSFSSGNTRARILVQS